EFSVTLDEGSKNLPIITASHGETWPSLQFIVSAAEVQGGPETFETAEVEISNFWRTFGQPEIVSSNKVTVQDVQEAQANAETDADKIDFEPIVVQQTDQANDETGAEQFGVEIVDVLDTDQANVETDAEDFEVEIVKVQQPGQANVETEAEQFEVENVNVQQSETAEDMPEFRAHEHHSESKPHLSQSHPELEKYSYIPLTYKKPFQGSSPSSYKEEVHQEIQPKAHTAYSPGPEMPLISSPPMTVPANPTNQQGTYFSYPNTKPVYVIQSGQMSPSTVPTGSRYISPYPAGMIISSSSNSLYTPTYRQSSNSVTNPGAPTLYYPRQYPEQQQQLNYVLSPKYPDQYTVSPQPQNVLTYPFVNNVNYI
ncbi:hypothetical protein Ocin01_00164, partial [Orchesella cincta]